MPAKGLAGRTKSEAARQRKDPMQNLKPFTKENAAEMGRKGGAASQKVKEAKTMPGRNPRVGAKRKKQRKADQHGIRRRRAQ